MAGRISGARAPGAPAAGGLRRLLPLLLSAARSPAAAAAALEGCSSKANDTAGRCAPTDKAACWTSRRGAYWYCLAAVGNLEDAGSLDQDCRSKLVLESSQAEEEPEVDDPEAWEQFPEKVRKRRLRAVYYEGACLLPPEEAPTTSSAPATPPATQEPVGFALAPDPLARANGSGELELLSWDDAYAKATATLALMNDSEKHALLQGVGYHEEEWWEVKKWHYVGNTPAMPHLGIPSLNMQDSGAGFHLKFPETAGTVTCWPSLLALAATWDPAAARSYAAAVGEEFAGKGANGILGPSLDVHRVARNGRNFEYLSGEDPYLGSRLAEAYVAGVQSRGVFAVIKHWIFNTQENNRENSSSVVDNRTAWELYYPPFEAAINAGASAVMCSYNRISGVFSCENEETLQGVLRGHMGFQGFVQSDWWAVHSQSVTQGLDQEMPGTGVETFFDNLTALAVAEPAAIDTAALRILAVIYRMRLEESLKCTPPKCSEWLMANVTSDQHAALAAEVATESIIMLKNEAGALPLRPPGAGGPRTIAVIGSAAAARQIDPDGAAQGMGDWATGDYYSGGGSGHVVAARVVTPLEGIQRRAEKAGVKVYASTSNDVQDALLVSNLADTIVVVVATTSGESRDREHLHLDAEADGLISTLSLLERGKRIVVLMQIPGAVVMPWRSSVDSILAMFLGGQETGTAWAAVLFGDRSPGGRLPLSMPETDLDEIAPSPGNNAVFSEALATGYRSKRLKAAFPFGHGLSYSDFTYGPLREDPEPCSKRPGQHEAVVCLCTQVSNSGSAPARAVAQLYLEFPPEAGYATGLLRGFVKTVLMQPGDAKVVVFALTARDISYYDAGRGWLMATQFTASVGESSADLRQSLLLERPTAAPTAVPTPVPTASTATTSKTSVTSETTTATKTTITSTTTITESTISTTTLTTTSTTSTTTTTPAPGWYSGDSGQNCDKKCQSVGLLCTQEGLHGHRADVDTSEEVLSLIYELGGNTSATACGSETGSVAAAPSWGPRNCTRVHRDRGVGTFNCTAVARRGRVRLCYCQAELPENSVIIMNRPISFPDIAGVAVASWDKQHIPGRFRDLWDKQRDRWNKQRIFSRFNDNDFWDFDQLRHSWDEKLNKQHALGQLRRRINVVDSGVFVAAGVAAVLLAVGSFAWARRRCMLGTPPGGEFAQLEILSEDVADPERVADRDLEDADEGQQVIPI